VGELCSAGKLLEGALHRESLSYLRTSWNIYRYTTPGEPVGRLFTPTPLHTQQQAAGSPAVRSVPTSAHSRVCIPSVSVFLLPRYVARHIDLPSCYRGAWYVKENKSPVLVLLL
jgi:hypothetical protein